MQTGGDVRESCLRQRWARCDVFGQKKAPSLDGASDLGWVRCVKCFRILCLLLSC